MAKILIIEDNASNRELVRVLLQEAGHTTLLAEEAESGLFIAINEKPSLIIMDIQMPGLDGLAATRQLKQNKITACIPVLALTALAMPEDEIKIKNSGCDGYLTKPIRYQFFLKEVARLLNE